MRISLGALFGHDSGPLMNAAGRILFARQTKEERLTYRTRKARHKEAVGVDSRKNQRLLIVANRAAQ
jgi:hypothetical protein